MPSKYKHITKRELKKKLDLRRPEIAKHFDVSDSTIDRYLKIYKLKLKTPIPGRSHKIRKITSTVYGIAIPKYYVKKYKLDGKNFHIEVKNKKLFIHTRTK